MPKEMRGAAARALAPSSNTVKSFVFIFVSSNFRPVGMQAVRQTHAAENTKLNEH
jgi:hypothetical protein